MLASLASVGEVGEVEWPGLNRDELAVTLAFGRAMLSCQRLEFTIFQLAQLDRRTPRGTAKALAQIDGLLKQSRGDQAKWLKGLTPKLLDDVREAVEVRNRLAHDGLFEAMLKIRVRGDDGRDEAIAMFKAISLSIDSVTFELDQIADKRLADAGIEELSEEDDDAILESLRRWSDDGPSAVEALKDAGLD